MRTTKETKETTPKRILRKLTVSERKLEIGEQVEGLFIGLTQNTMLDKATGEEVIRYKAVLEEPGTRERFFVWGNSGLRSALNDAMIEANTHIVIERLEKKKLTGGRTMNQYDIFVVQN